MKVFAAFIVWNFNSTLNERHYSHSYMVILWEGAYMNFGKKYCIKMLKDELIRK